MFVYSSLCFDVYVGVCVNVYACGDLCSLSLSSLLQVLWREVKTKRRGEPRRKLAVVVPVEEMGAGMVIGQ